MMAAGLGVVATQACATPVMPQATGQGLPPGACDCHVHVFFDPALYSFAPGRAYTPPTATVEALNAWHEAVGIQRTVVVAPSVYGVDPRPTLDAIARLGLDRARGVAVFDANSTPAQLAALHAGGVRGLRLNIDMGGEDVERRVHDLLALAAGQARAMGWHIQVAARLSVLAGAEATLGALDVPVVFDHFANARAEQGADQPGLDRVLRLIGSGKAWVKLSAPYRVSSRPTDYADVDWLAQALVAANPDRVVWGSDWPHPGGAIPADYQPAAILPNYQIDDRFVLDCLARWVPDASLRRRILSDNPTTLYGFPAWT